MTNHNSAAIPIPAAKPDGASAIPIPAAKPDGASVVAGEKPTSAKLEILRQSIAARGGM